MQSKRNIKKCLLYFFSLLFFSFAHPFYLSVTDLKYNPDDKKLQGTVKIFSNDLEESLKILEKKPIDLLHPKDRKETLSILKRYLAGCLTLEVNSQKLGYEVLGFENEEESIWIYLESKACEKPSGLLIQNSILYEHLKEQMNIVNIEVGGIKKSWKQNNPEKSFRFDF